MEAWDQEYVNMEVPGHFTFKKGGVGNFHFGLVGGEIDYRIEREKKKERIEFTLKNQAVSLIFQCRWAAMEGLRGGQPLRNRSCRQILPCPRKDRDGGTLLSF